MKDLSGHTAIVTGASRGIGAHIAAALAGRGARLALVARTASDLEKARAALIAKGAAVIAVSADITKSEAQEHLISETRRAFGSIDLLVNNAGIVVPSAYELLSLESIEQHIAINLTAPMTLTRRVLPLMLERGRGQIVNVASLGGLVGVAWGEAYSASKHGLVGFTRSLRATCRASGSAVSASVVCPGFIDDVGMYADHERAHGSRAPITLGTSTPEAVVAAVLRAIDRDLPEVIVSERPVRLLLALSALFPSAGEWLFRKLNAHAVFQKIAQATGAVSRSAR